MLLRKFWWLDFTTDFEGFFSITKDKENELKKDYISQTFSRSESVMRSQKVYAHIIEHISCYYTRIFLKKQDLSEDLH